MRAAWGPGSPNDSSTARGRCAGARSSSQSSAEASSSSFQVMKPQPIRPVSAACSANPYSRRAQARPRYPPPTSPKAPAQALASAPPEASAIGASAIGMSKPKPVQKRGPRSFGMAADGCRIVGWRAAVQGPVTQAMNGTNASQAMRGNSFLVRRQVQHKAGATASVVFAVHAAVVAPGNRAHQGQPQAHAAGALAGAGQAVEGLEDAFAL